MHKNKSLKSYNAALYYRLSEEDLDLAATAAKKESDSISNQKLLISQYLKNVEENIEIYDSYVDDGFTGTNFERPGFKRLLEDIQQGIVTMVIVKDLSYMSFQCRNYRNNQSCENMEMINDTDLYDLVMKVIIQQIKLINNYKDVIESGIEQVFKSNIGKCSEALNKVQNQIAFLRNQKMVKYADFVEERIEREEYVKWKKECEALQLRLEIEHKDAAKTLRQLQALKNRTIKTLNKYIKNGKLEMQKEDIQFFIDRIIFYGGNRIEIKLNFKDVWDMLQEKRRGENLA